MADELTRIRAVLMESDHALPQHEHEQILCEAEALQARAERAEAEMNNLTARIHRDGGHYTAEHGREKSLTDADKVVAELFAERDRLLEALWNIEAKTALAARAMDDDERGRNIAKAFDLIGQLARAALEAGR